MAVADENHKALIEHGNYDQCNPEASHIVAGLRFHTAVCNGIVSGVCAIADNGQQNGFNTSEQHGNLEAGSCLFLCLEGRCGIGSRAADGFASGSCLFPDAGIGFYCFCGEAARNRKTSCQKGTVAAFGFHCLVVLAVVEVQEYSQCNAQYQQQHIQIPVRRTVNHFYRMLAGI